MKKFGHLLLLIITVGVLACPAPAYCQAHCSLLQANNAAEMSHTSSSSYWFGIMELPFLFISVFFAFLTAYALRLSSVSLAHMMRDITTGGSIDHGELWLDDETGKRPLPTSLFARWSA